MPGAAALTPAFLHITETLSPLFPAAVNKIRVPTHWKTCFRAAKDGIAQALISCE